MKILEAIKTSGVITYKNIAIFQTLVLSSIIMSILLSPSVGMASNKIYFISYLLLLLFLGTALEAGFLNTIKKAISIELDTQITNEEKEIEHFKSFKSFFPGVGEYFLPLLIWQILLFIFMIIISQISNPIGEQLLQRAGIDIAKLQTLSVNSDLLMTHVQSFTPNQLATMALYAFGTMAITLLLIFWWLPALFYNSKNPFVAIKENFIFLFKHFGQTIVLFIFLCSLFTVVGTISLIFNINPILSLIGLFLQFYTFAFSFVLIFLYYGQNGEHSAKDYINSGDNGNGEKLAGSDSGEEA